MSTATGPGSTDEHAQPYDASGSGMPREAIGLRRIGDFTLTWGESLRWDDRRRRLYFVDCAAQTLHWLDAVANVREHGTTHETPRERFERAERLVLRPLAARPYRSLVLVPDTPPPVARPPVPRVPVERRPLTAYAALTGGGR